MHSHYTVRPRPVSSGNQLRRRWVGTPPPPSPRSTGNPLFITLAAAAAVGAYYFMQRAPPDESRGKQAQQKYDPVKDSASDTLSKTRGSVEKVYDKTKAASDEKLAEVRSELGDQSQKIQQGWLSWLGWGKSRENRPGDMQRASGAASAERQDGKRAEKNI